MWRKRHGAFGENGLAGITALALVIYLASRAVNFLWAGREVFMLVAMAFAGTLVWLCFLLWFARTAPVVAVLAFLAYAASRLVRIEQCGVYWLDARSYYAHDGTWPLAEMLVAVAFGLLTYALWRTHEVPRPVLLLFIVYIAVTLVRAMVVDSVDIGTHAELTFFRNLSGGLCYSYLVAYFLVESRTVRG
ncbi:hypothetical protein CKALI_00965 [Corynebacterium kalinowskii]|uniref:Uncharacterized protein n=1 Tax=Corynebacterium kalinowskii TaxID=2675216 RepID=A0A6B8V9P5_9CORY|nr:hypothetical protein [Corynebacterium kalinowskii]QGU01093.1 hypothetical protein CKALI_00965 [Corynebacterium kalinowskii]